MVFSCERVLATEKWRLFGIKWLGVVEFSWSRSIITIGQFWKLDISLLLQNDMAMHLHLGFSKYPITGKSDNDNVEKHGFHSEVTSMEYDAKGEKW